MELLQLLLLLLQLLLLKLRLLLVLMLCCIGSICRTRRRRGRVSCGTGGWRLLLLLLPLMHCCTCRWCLLRRRPSRQRPANGCQRRHDVPAAWPMAGAAKGESAVGSSAPISIFPQSCKECGRPDRTLQSPVLRLPECRGNGGGTWTEIELHLEDVREVHRAEPTTLAERLCPPPKSSRPLGRNGDTLRSPVLRIPERPGVRGGTWTAIELPGDEVREVVCAEPPTLAEHSAVHPARIVPANGLGVFSLEELPALDRHGLPAEMAIRCSLLYFGSRSAEETAEAPGR